MARTLLPNVEDLGELLEQLGGIAPHRVRLHPQPGTATEKDVLALLERKNRLFELIDGVLVEKVMGYLEASLATWLGFLLEQFLQEHPLGNLAGSDGTLRLMPGLVRIPDLSFVRWEKLPAGHLSFTPIPDLVPDLAVEVLSEGNTPSEMRRKLRDYFMAGVQLVWFVQPQTQTIEVYTAPDRRITLTENDSLEGGALLPGLALPLRRIFERVPRNENQRTSSKAAPRRPTRKATSRKKR